MQRHVHNLSRAFFLIKRTQRKSLMRMHANIWHLIGRLNQTAADGFLPLKAFKPSSSDSADRGCSIIRVSQMATETEFAKFKGRKLHFREDNSLLFWSKFWQNGTISLRQQNRYIFLFLWKASEFKAKGSQDKYPPPHPLNFLVIGSPLPTEFIFKRPPTANRKIKINGVPPPR